jgi:hypothetical protein
MCAWTLRLCGPTRPPGVTVPCGAGRGTNPYVRCVLTVVSLSLGSTIFCSAEILQGAVELIGLTPEPHFHHNYTEAGYLNYNTQTGECKYIQYLRFSQREGSYCVACRL